MKKRKSMTAMSVLAALALACTCFVSGCASSGSTVNTKRGAVIGGLLGATAGAVIGNQSGNALEGAAIGAAAGAAAGAVTGSSVDEKKTAEQNRYR